MTTRNTIAEYIKKADYPALVSEANKNQAKVKPAPKRTKNVTLGQTQKLHFIMLIRFLRVVEDADPYNV